MKIRWRQIDQKQRTLWRYSSLSISTKPQKSSLLLKAGWRNNRSCWHCRVCNENKVRLISKPPLWLPLTLPWDPPISEKERKSSYFLLLGLSNSVRFPLSSFSSWGYQSLCSTVKNCNLQRPNLYPTICLRLRGASVSIQSSFSSLTVYFTFAIFSKIPLSPSCRTPHRTHVSTHSSTQCFATLDQKVNWDVTYENEIAETSIF